MASQVTKRADRRYFLGFAGLSLILFLLLALAIRHWQSRLDRRDRVLIRIYPQTEQQIARLRQMKFIPDTLPIGDYIEVEGYFKDVLDLNYQGIPAAIVIESEQQATLDSSYLSYEELTARMNNLIQRAPEWAQLDTIGYSAFYRKPIVAVKLSDFPEENEFEPSVLVMAGHHAREPIGIFVCLALVDSLLSGWWPESEQILRETQIWVVPCVNPDGYDYIVTNRLRFPWWRKNLRDNDNDLKFSPEKDGVDLNRNYDFNWEYGGSDQKETWYYRGPGAASEPEVQAIQKLAERERFVLAVDYHSFGEAVLYPWARELAPPDSTLIKNIARELARRLQRTSAEKFYRTIPLNGKSGQSANWLYANFRTIALIVETGPEYFPPLELRNQIVADQMKGLQYLLSRCQGAAITGIVVEAGTNKPVSAILQLEADFSPVVAPFRSDPVSGRFWRLLLPGKYRLSVYADGYREQQLPYILIPEDRPIYLRIELERPPANLN